MALVTNPLQAGLEAWHMDFKVAEPYYKEDLTAARQLLSAMNYDASKEWEAVCSNSNAVNATMAEVWAQQMAKADIKLRILSLPLAQILPQKLNVSQFDFWIGSQPGGDTRRALCATSTATPTTCSTTLDSSTRRSTR